MDPWGAFIVAAGCAFAIWLTDRKRINARMARRARSMFQGNRQP